MSPSQFQQLFVIRAPLGASAVSCVYVLLSDKTQRIYEIWLKAVVDKCDSISYGICDFEHAVINAVTAVLGSQVNVHGCFYHLTQGTGQNIGNSVTLQSTKTGKEGKGARVSSIPQKCLTEVAEGMEHIRASIPTGNRL